MINVKTSYVAILFVLLGQTVSVCQSYLLDQVFPDQCNSKTNIKSVFENKNDIVHFFSDHELYLNDETNHQIDLKFEEEIGENLVKRAGNYHWYYTHNNEIKIIHQGKIIDPIDIGILSPKDVFYLFENNRQELHIVTKKGVRRLSDNKSIAVLWKETCFHGNWSHDIQSDGTVWLTNDKGGIYLFSPDLEKVTYREVYDNAYSNCIFIDNQDTVWLSYPTFIVGIINNEVGRKINIPNNDAIKIAKDDNNVLWLQNEKLGFIHPITNTFTNIFSEQQFPNIKINDFLISEANGIWIATSNGLYFHPGPSLSFYDFDEFPKTKLRKQFFILSDKKYLSKSKEVFEVNVKKAQPYKKVSTLSSPYKKKYDHAQNSFKLYYKNTEKTFDLKTHILKSTKKIIPNYVVDYLEIDNEDALIVTNNQIYLESNPKINIDLSKHKNYGKVLPYSIHSAKKQHILNSNQGYFNVQLNLGKLDIIKLNNDKLVASTPIDATNYYESIVGAYNNGLNVIPEDNQQLKPIIFPILDGQEKVLDIIQIDKLLWVKTNSKIIGYELDSLCYSKKLISKYISTFSAFHRESRLDVDSKGIIWIYTDKNIYNFDKSLLKENDQLVVESVVSNNSKSKQEPISSWFQKLYKVDNNLNLELDLSAYRNKQKSILQYKLESENVWKNIPRDGSIQMNHLDFGKHSLLIRICGLDLECKISDTIPLKIKKPILQSWWFLFLLTLSIIFLLKYLIQNLRNKIYKTISKKDELIELVMKIEELEKKKFSSELHDSVGQSLILLKNNALIKKDQEIVQMVDHTLAEMRYLINKARPADIEKYGLTKSIETLVERFDHNSSIILTHEIKNIDGILSIDGEKHLYRIIQEFLSNLVKHSRSTAGQIKIETDKTIIVFIKDNGIGYKFNEAERKTKGIGLKSIKDRIIHLGGTMTTSFLKDEYGSIIEIKIPFVKKKFIN